MTRNIPKGKWKKFFDQVSKCRYEWIVKIEVIGQDIGDQTLYQGLPLIGITAEDRGDEPIIEISVGQAPDLHQSHPIADPTAVAYLSNKGDEGGTVEILENDGTKTLVHLVRPMQLVIDYSKDREIAAA